MHPIIGTKQRDQITGFEGTATGYVEYMTGCNQVLLSPAVGADGALRESNWFDVQRLVPVDAPKIALDNGASPGFDKAPPRY